MSGSASDSLQARRQTSNEMPSFFRSAPMVLFQLYIPTESAQAVMAELGVLGTVQFIDLNTDVTAFQRTFTSDIRQLDEMGRVVRVLLEHAGRESVAVKSWADSSLETLAIGESAVAVPTVGNTWTALQGLEDAGPVLFECEARVRQLDESQSEIQARFLQTLEWHAVLVALESHLMWARAGGLAAASAPFADHTPDEKALNSLKSSGSASPRHSSGVFAVEKDAAAEEDSRASDMLELGQAHRSTAALESSFVTGAIPRRKLEAFQRVLWRALRGNVFIRSADMVMDTRGVVQNAADSTALSSENDVAVASQDQKSAFIAYVHGRETLVRLRKICTALGASLFDVAGHGSDDDRRVLQSELEAKLDDMHSVLLSTRQAKRAVLSGVADGLERTALLIVKKKALFDAMNKLSCDSDVSARRYFVAEAWCPAHELPVIEETLRMASAQIDAPVAPVLTRLDATGRVPPTYFRCNRFTRVFQDLTEAYGVASYREANPSLFMIISFPFLFAIMFGDVGHALIMISAAAWLVYREGAIEAEHRGRKMDEVFALIFGGRYILMLMGIFSLYVGLLYNDAFSLALSIFPSAWEFDDHGVGHRDPSSSYVYPLGIDWKWSLSSNFMVFLNSYKMKQAILLGIVQMIFGICISATNFVHAGSMVDVYCTFLPQILFMTSIFGYLAFLIIYKWLSGWDASILGILITMLLHGGQVDGKPVFAGQHFVQLVLLAIAVVCVPWMMLAKPLYLMYEKRRLTRMGYRLHSAEEERPRASAIAEDIGALALDSGAGMQGALNSRSTGSKVDTPPAVDAPKSPDALSEASVSSTTRKAAASSDEHGASELWVHQLIHTIEFVLGSVSNTASYLRLWALSLAHAELSHVLWSLTIGKFSTSAVMLMILYPLWLGMTVAVLVGMEGMSAFLHALRLHWVEFNNKFYAGTGHKFDPLSLRDEDISTVLDLPNR